MLADLGLTVTRHIPLDTIAGLVTGVYSLHGGVIRDAGGRIVSHLVTSGASGAASSLVPGLNLLAPMIQQAQVWQLSRDVAALRSSVETVLNVSMAGAALSGLGLVTSMVGFAFLNNRLQKLDSRLESLEKEVKGIKDLVVGLQRSKLQFAIDNVRHAESASNDALKQDLLLQSKREFGTLTHHYQDQWARSRTLREVEAVNELYTLAILGHAIVCSNLGLCSDAANDLRDHSNDWTKQSRVHAKTLMFSERPDRWLSGEFVDVLPARSLIALLDFAHDDRKGIDWLDELRLAHARDGTVLDNLASSAPAGLQRILGKGDLGDRVTLARSLMARADVMAANVEYFQFLDAKRLSATVFQKLLNEARIESGSDAVCVSVGAAS